MKRLFVVFLIFCANSGWSADRTAPPRTAVLTGEVLEVKDVSNYTYMRLKTRDGETWVAVGTAHVMKGSMVTIDHPEQMDNFESKALKRTFPKIYFGTLASSGAATSTTAVQLAKAHSGVAQAGYEGNVTVPKASGPDARTVAEIVTKSAELQGKTVIVRARVVKYTPSIMGKNWVHLRDGSGSAADSTNDVSATTQNQAKVRDVVLAKGIVRKDKDFGSGYVYKVLIEDAALGK